jgi:ABC-type uncharacterized transport system permease subunit
VANLIFVPLSFASGLFIPVAQLPGFIQKIPPYLPTYHYGQIAWNAIGAPSEAMSTAAIAIVVWAMVLFALARHRSTDSAWVASEGPGGGRPPALHPACQGPRA